MIPNFIPRFSYTHKLVRDLGVVEAARAVIDLLPLPPDASLRLRHASGFDMMRFSGAREVRRRSRAILWTQQQSATRSPPARGLALRRSRRCYEGRNDPDHTPWIEYFVGILAQAAKGAVVLSSGDVTAPEDLALAAPAAAAVERLTGCIAE